MKRTVQRGKIVYLTVEGHSRVLPTDTDKFGKRPFLVVQRDYANADSNRSLVVGITTEPQNKVAELAKKRFAGVEAFLPKGPGLVNEDSIADCGNILTVYDREIHDIFDSAYLIDVMRYVDQALRVALDLDPDGCYLSQL